MVEIHRAFAHPDRWTYRMKPVDELLDRVVGDGLWIDPFAGRSVRADVTNDLNPDRYTDFSVEADEFLKQFDVDQVDGGVLFDPPYSYEQVKRAYENVGKSPSREDTSTAFYSAKRTEIERICADGARVVSFGWNTTGMGKTYGFEKEEILLVNHGAGHHDTLVTVERQR